MAVLDGDVRIKLLIMVFCVPILFEVLQAIGRIPDMKKQSSYGRILLVRISMLAMTVIAALWWQEKAESMGLVYACETDGRASYQDKTHEYGTVGYQWILQMIVSDDGMDLFSTRKGWNIADAVRTCL